MDDLRGSSLVGRTLAHYRISAAIGAGGMGEVYRATDTKLGRDVAIKVLPRNLAGDPDRLARFQREGRALAALNHPNIITIFSVEEDEGIHFLTMELIEGQAVDRLISANGLPIERIVEIAGAIAEALAAAHEKGIVHRDLKPANVMVTDEGRVKVLDFGLAKDVGAETADGATLTSKGRTQAGMMIGTPAYMSPEQVSGRTLDHRSDIFSLGVMLHEMATGRRPFEGRSPAELISSILRDTPPSVRDRRPELPSDLARVIRRCLEKDPRYRVQTARDIGNEFRDLARMFSGGSGVAAAPSPGARPAPTASGENRADEGFWIAVLPFKHAGNNSDLKALADGLSEEIITGLSRFSYLRVIARGSTAQYSSESGDIRAVGKELGARYVMEGTLRQAGAKLRVAVQVVDASSGAHLWAETYERVFSPEAVFELQDELVPRIVSTVADAYGVLLHSMSEALRTRSPEQLTPYEAFLRGFGYFLRVNPKEHAAVRTSLEQAVEQAPGNADCWALLSMVYREEYNHGFNARPDPLGRALAAARRAIEIAPANHLAYSALASAQFFRRDIHAFRSAAQRAIALNSMDGFTIGYVGFMTAYSGDWERGCALAERARNLNPHHPGWYWLPPFLNAYRKGDYAGALEFALKVNMPGFWRSSLALAATYGQLGETALARNAVQELLAIRPGFEKIAREECAKSWEPELVEKLLDGLRKAGMEVANVGVAPAASSGAQASPTASGAMRVDEGFWVAVPSFTCGGSKADLKPLAEGLTEEIITGLSRFSYLRVIARGSTARYSSESGDVRAIGKELSARYVMEGSLRHAGSKLRLAVRLADATTGAHLWAETFERGFHPEAAFELQDELVPCIVSTVADMNGVLPRNMSEVLRSSSEDSLTPHEAVLRAFGFFARMTPEEHAAVRGILERAVREAPDLADCWAMLAMMYNIEFADGFNPRPNPLDRALAAAQRAIDLAPTHSLGHHALACAHFFRKEMIPFHAAVERAVALNPMDGSVLGFLGVLVHHSGELERGRRMVETAMRLNPNYPGLFRFVPFHDAYNQGKYADALAAAVRINTPGFFHAHAARAAAYGQLGQREAAQKEVQQLLALRPHFADEAREEYAKWFGPDIVEHWVEGLRKAGLDVPGESAPPLRPVAG